MPASKTAVSTVVSTVDGLKVTVEITGPPNGGYTVTIRNLGGVTVEETSGTLDANGKATVTFTLAAGSYTSETRFAGKPNTRISEDLDVLNDDRVSGDS